MAETKKPATAATKPVEKKPVAPVEKTVAKKEASDTFKAELASVKAELAEAQKRAVEFEREANEVKSSVQALKVARDVAVTTDITRKQAIKKTLLINCAISVISAAFAIIAISMLTWGNSHGYGGEFTFAGLDASLLKLNAWFIGISVAATVGSVINSGVYFIKHLLK